MRIVVDAMGGDYAPHVVIDGAIQAVKEYGADVILVGDKSRIGALLHKCRYRGDRISIHHAPDCIEMGEGAAAGVRRKRNSSIVIGMNLLKEGAGKAFFSAGNTGAVVCAATLELGLLPGIERPGIGTVMPSMKGKFLILDVGANIDPKPVHLLQYGIMGSAYAQYILNVAQPKVGLLNVGEEAGKGTGFVKESYDLLAKARLNFVGNVEGKHFFAGDCDVVVCDGFVGNVTLKVAESLADALQRSLRRHIKSNPLSILGGLLLKPSFKKFKAELDYSEYGGAPLLGVNGVVIIGHGRSNKNAIKNAIRVAKEEVERNVNEQILNALKPT